MFQISDVNIIAKTYQFATTKKRHPHSFDYSEKTVQWIFKTIDLFENARKNAAR